MNHYKMERALSTHLFVNHRLTSVWLDRIWDAGIPLVEIFCAKQHIDWHNKAQIAELGHWFRDSDLKLHSIHAPMYNDDVWGRSGPQATVSITERDKAKRIQAIDEIKRALEIAEVIPMRYVIQHLGAGGEEFDEYKVEAAFGALEELSLFARQRGVELLLENTPNNLSNAEKLLVFFELTHMNLNVCFDVGHAHMYGSIESEYRALKSRIRSTHIHDNDGLADKHLFPLQKDGAGGGNIDWVKTMALLESAPHQYPLLLELREVEGMDQPIQAAARVFDKLEELTAVHER